MREQGTKGQVDDSPQAQVRRWALDCFGREIADDRVERAYRFVEAALELFQACGHTQHEALQLVAYVFGRPKGTVPQEVGGVYLTLAALCSAHRLDLEKCADTELRRCYERMDEIREKQRRKPRMLG